MKDQEEKQELRNKLERLMMTMKKNREKVPLEVLKSKYGKAYATLKKELQATASDYATLIILFDIRIRMDYLDEAKAIIEQLIKESGILKQLSDVISHKYDITLFDSLSLIMRQKIQEALEPFYWRHCVLYFSSKCLDTPGTLPQLYCLANGCIWKNEKWVPAVVSASKKNH